MSEIRYFKGKFKVEVIEKVLGICVIRAIEKVVLADGRIILPSMKFKADAKLLWRHRRCWRRPTVKRDLEVEGV